MTSIREALRRFFQPSQPLPAGVYHFQAPPSDPRNLRLHLRLDADGEGMLIVNASTVLHLNRTAAEYVYHIVRQTPAEQVARDVSKRYRVSNVQALKDFQDISERIQSLVNTPDLDPESFLGFDRLTPHAYSGTPYRLDCALTYQLPSGADPSLAPIRNVTRELSTDEWKTILSQAWEAGFIHIIFTGGEATLRSDLPELIRQAEANGQVTGLLTDGTRLADPGYLQELLQTGVDHLMLLCQPENPQFWQALENSLAADIYVTVHLTLTPENSSKGEELLHKLAEKGVRAISLSAADASLASRLSNLRNLASGLEMTLVWDIPVPYSSLNPVALETQVGGAVEGAGSAWLYVEPDGDLKSSQASPQPLGNLLTEPWQTLLKKLAVS